MKIYAVSLGCPKNRIDTEIALGSIGAEKDFSLVDEPCEADLLLVNTCGFLEEAVSESIESVLDLAGEKRADQTLAVMGCMVQRYGGNLQQELPEVDVFMGTGNPENLGLLLAKVHYKKAAHNQPIRRILTTPPWRAYVKISEGCSNRCTYCVIPSIRGPRQCRSLSDIVAEARALDARGIKEVTLVAQDLTAYEHENCSLPDLIDALVAETDIPWFRLLYLHPARIDRRLVETMAGNSRICPYFDIPIQHASDRVLRAMGRDYDAETIDALIRDVRKIIPNASLRTTVMVGFPGETDEDFRILSESIEVWKFDHLGCFEYSDEEDCPAHKFPHKIAEGLSQERRRVIMDVQARISRDLNARKIGSVEDVLIEGYSRETDLLLEGRTRFQAPDIDGVVYINRGEAAQGEIVPVRITESHTYDLVGETGRVSGA